MRHQSVERHRRNGRLDEHNVNGEYACEYEFGRLLANGGARRLFDLCAKRCAPACRGPLSRPPPAVAAPQSPRSPSAKWSTRSRPSRDGQRHRAPTRRPFRCRTRTPPATETLTTRHLRGGQGILRGTYVRSNAPLRDRCCARSDAPGPCRLARCHGLPRRSATGALSSSALDRTPKPPRQRSPHHTPLVPGIRVE